MKYLTMILTLLPVMASAQTWSAPLPGVHAQFSGDHECRAVLGQEWRLPEADELQGAIELGLVPELASTYPGTQPGTGAHRYLWSATQWKTHGNPQGSKGWGKLFRLEDRTWVREAEDACYSVVCVRD